MSKGWNPDVEEKDNSEKLSMRRNSSTDMRSSAARRLMAEWCRGYTHTPKAAEERRWVVEVEGEMVAMMGKEK